MDQSVENCVGDRGVGDDLMPLSDRELAGDERGAVTLPIVEYFQELPVEFAGDARDAQIIDDEEWSPSDPFEQRGHAPVHLPSLQTLGSTHSKSAAAQRREENSNWS